MDVVNLVIRRQVERLFPGLPWHQGVAVLTTVWLILVAAMAIALADLRSEPALAGRQVVVRMPAPAKGGPAPRPLTATPSDAARGSDPAPSDAGNASTPAPAAPAAPGAAPAEEPFPSAPAPATLPPLESVPTDPGTGGNQPEATTWKAGAEAYTVALDSFTKEAEAGGAVDAALAAGIETGSVASGGFASLRDGLFVVFSGYHATLSEARKAADDLATRGYTRAQPVYFSEKRARRCEDGEQPRQAIAQDTKGAAKGGAGATPRGAGAMLRGAGATLRAAGGSGGAPRAAGGGDSDTATTGGDSNTATSGGENQTTGGAGDQGGGQTEQLPVIEVPCEVRPADEKPGKGGSSGDAGGGPAVKP